MDKLNDAAAAVAQADRELAVSLVALLHGAAGDEPPEHPMLPRLHRFASALRAALGESLGETASHERATEG